MTLAAIGLADVLAFLIAWIILVVLFVIVWSGIAAGLRRRRSRP